MAKPVTDDDGSSSHASDRLDCAIATFTADVTRKMSARTNAPYCRLETEKPVMRQVDCKSRARNNRSERDRLNGRSDDFEKSHLIIQDRMACFEDRIACFGLLERSSSLVTPD
jgi:hypothetical protein